MMKITSYGLGVYKLEAVANSDSEQAEISSDDIISYFAGQNTYFEYVSGSKPDSVIVMTESGLEPCEMELSQFESDEPEVSSAVRSHGSRRFRNRVRDLTALLASR